MWISTFTQLGRSVGSAAWPLRVCMCTRHLVWSPLSAQAALFVARRVGCAKGCERCADGDRRYVAEGPLPKPLPLRDGARQGGQARATGEKVPAHSPTTTPIRAGASVLLLLGPPAFPSGAAPCIRKRFFEGARAQAGLPGGPAPFFSLLTHIPEALAAIAFL